MKNFLKKLLIIFFIFSWITIFASKSFFTYPTIYNNISSYKS